MSSNSVMFRTFGPLTLPSDFRGCKHVGEGGNGAVCLATLGETATDPVAIKMIPKYDAHPEERARRIYREVDLLRAFQCCPQVVRCYGMFRNEGENNLYIVMEYVSGTLYEAIQSKAIATDDEGLVRSIMLQLLVAVRALHCGSTTHRDLSTPNVLYDVKTKRVVLCDFGLARIIEREAAVMMSMGVTAEPYRAPEIHCGVRSYTQKVDMWSVGVIMAELLTGKPLFHVSDAMEQFRRVFEAVGWPDEALFAPGGSYEQASPASKRAVASLRQVTGQQSAGSNPLATLPDDEDSTDLVKKLLVFDPNKRLSVDEALSHKYFTKDPEAVAYIASHVMQESNIGSHPVPGKMSELVRSIEQSAPVWSEDVKKAIADRLTSPTQCPNTI